MHNCFSRLIRLLSAIGCLFYTILAWNFSYFDHTNFLQFAVEKQLRVRRESKLKLIKPKHDCKKQRRQRRDHRNTIGPIKGVHSLVHRRLCLYRPQMKSPHRSHHVGWAWLHGWKLCPSPLSSVNCGSWLLLRTRMMPTRLSRSGTLPGLILRALALSRRGGEKGARVSSMGSLSDLRSRSSMNSPRDIAAAAVTSLFARLSLTSRETNMWSENLAKNFMAARWW